jgi:hypothetical protein
MGWDDAQRVQLSWRTSQYEVRMSPSGDELWLGVACKFIPWEPPGGRSRATFRQDWLEDGYDPSRESDAEDERIAVHSWSRYQQEWGRFKSNFVSRVADVFNNKLILRHSSSRSRNAGNSAGMSQFPERIACWLHLWEVEERAHCTCLVFRAASRTPFRYQGDLNLGGPRMWCSPFPLSNAIILEDGSAGPNHGRVHMVLSSNAVNTVDTGFRTEQMAAAHEMGHYLGLHHRCEPRTDPDQSDPSEARSVPEEANQPSSPTFENRQYDGYHPRAAQDRDPVGQDAYCGMSTNRAAITDLMAMGNDINPWHGFAWQDIIQRVNQGPGGIDFTRTSWGVERAG